MVTVHPPATPVLSRPAGYLHEVDGVRGIALALVVGFHVFGNGRVSGGIDVFLVISAFFLTRKLLLHLDGSNGPQLPIGAHASWLGRHYTGVLSRLVPSVAIVLLGVLAATRLFAYPSQYPQHLREVVASALYIENWELIGSQLAYEAAGPQTSPLQHFWSLAVQGQFFLVWPLIAFAVALPLARRAGGYRGPLVLTVTLATVLSFGWAMHQVNLDQQVAYFDTFSRVWELGAGALIALIPGKWFARAWVREGGVWLGLTMIVSSGFLFDGSTLFPGPATLWPVVGTLLALFGASRDTAPGLTARLLHTSPIRYLASISFQLYLWHWPVLIFYLQIRGWSQVGFLGATVVVTASLALASATQWLTSRRWLAVDRSTFRWRNVWVPLLALGLVVSIAATWRADIEQRHAAAVREAVEFEGNYIGALANTDPAAAARISTNVPPRPAFADAAGDRPAVYEQGCVQTLGEQPGQGEVLICDVDNYGAEHTLVITGASHALQWYPALQTIAREHGWRLVVAHKSSCPLTNEPGLGTCSEWNRDAFDVIMSYAPDAVFTLGTRSEEEPGLLDAFYPPSVAVWQQFSDAGVSVLGIRDTPRLPFDVPECLEANSGDTALCRYPRSEIYSPDIMSTSAHLPESFRLLDLTDAIMGPEYFDPIVGNVVVYRDSGHLTATYAATMTPMLKQALREADPDLFTRK